MEIQDFKNYIDNPVNLQEEDFEKIQSLLEKYPFFHSANLLFVKAAHNINHEVYKTAISRVSASVPNREMLHELITLKEIKIIPTDKIKEKTEESQTRKDIREKIQKRRDKRQIEKIDGLKEDGKSKHASLIKDFFEPIFTKLRKSPNEYNVVIERKIEGAVQEIEETTIIDERERKKAEREKRMAEKRKLRALETTDEDKEKAKLERDKKKAEREKRMAEKRKLRAEETTDEDKETVKSERDKKKAEREKRMAEKRKLRALETTDEDKEKAKLERDKRKAEREKRMAEKLSLKEEAENEPQNIEKATEEKLNIEVKDKVTKIDSKVSEKKESVEKESKKIEIIKIESELKPDLDDEIIIESEIPDKKETLKSKSKDTINEEIKIDKDDDPYTKIITIPSGDDQKEIKTIDADEIIIKTESKDKTESDKTIKKIETGSKKQNEKKDQVIIEDIKTETDPSGTKDEGVVIENIYDKIISSKKPKPTHGNKHVFIEITDDITGLIDVEENTEEIVEISDNKNEDVPVDKRTDDIEIKIKSDESKIKEKIESDIKESKIEAKDNDIEFIVEDSTDIKFISDDIKEEKVEEKVLLEDSTEESFEFIEKEDKTTELIDKKEDKQDAKKVDDPKTEAKEADTKNDKELKSKKDLIKQTEAKAANDVLARIAAFKNKKIDEGLKDKTKEKETEESEDLIKKFVDEKPGMKRNEVEVSEIIDISEESTKIKKPVNTELMASIYINQGKYNEAISIYEKLILKNPEKKDYFAAKIKETEKLK